jgi:hypothetical protein
MAKTIQSYRDRDKDSPISPREALTARWRRQQIAEVDRKMQLFLGF